MAYLEKLREQLAEWKCARDYWGQETEAAEDVLLLRELARERHE